MADLARDRRTGSDAGDDRLESWKEIAAYLKRDVRTVQRWERREALPVHRQLHDKQGSVYAFRSEIEQWREKQSRTPAFTDETEETVLPSPRLTTSSRLWYGVILFFLATCVVVYLGIRKKPATIASSIQAIAVLPIANLSGDRSQDYLTEGLTDEIITDLAKMGGLRVISRTSSTQYKGTDKPIPQIARELNVDAIVEGSFERAGQKVRLRVQLIRGATDQHLWAEGYDREFNDVFRLESEVAHDIAEHVQSRLTQSQEQLFVRSHTPNPEAFQDYLQGRHYWALRSKESLKEAIEYFERAIQKDPEDARSYAGLAQTYLVLPFLTGTPAGEAFNRAKGATDRALSLDASLPEAHLANATILLYRDWDLFAAEREFRRTLEINPNYSTAHMWYGEVLVQMARGEEAIREEQAALALDPLSAIVHHEMANILRDAGRYEESVRAYEDTLNIDPRLVAAYWEMSVAFQRQGKLTESIRELRKGAKGVIDEYGINPAVIPAIDGLESAYKHLGRDGYFRQLLKVHQYQLRPSFYLARDHTQLGNKEAAFVELKHAYEDHDPEFLSIFTDPELEPLRGDPQFQKLVSAVRFQ